MKHRHIETDEHRRAFDCYYRLGAKRNLKQAAIETGLNLDKMGRWSTWFNWQKQVAQKDALAIKAIDKQLDRDIIATIQKQHKQTLALYSKTHERVINGLGAKPSVKDAIDLMRHELLLHGDARVMPGRDATASAPPVTLNLQVIIDALGVLPSKTLNKFLDKLEAIDGDVVSPQPPDDNPSDAIVETK